MKENQKTANKEEIVVKTKPKFIYIMTNASFHASNWVKIGCSDDVERRRKELSDKTAVPLDYEIYATYELPENPSISKPDKAIHEIIGTLAPLKRINKRKEFFEIEPWEAYDVLENIAKLHNRVDKLKRYSNDFGAEIIQGNTDEISVSDTIIKNKETQKRYNDIVSIIKSLDKNLTFKPLKYYVAVKNKKQNIFAIWPQNHCLEIILYAKFGELKTNNDNIYDISNRLWTSAQYAIKYRDKAQENEVKEIFKQVLEIKK